MGSRLHGILAQLNHHRGSSRSATARRQPWGVNRFTATKIGPRKHTRGPSARAIDARRKILVGATIAAILLIIVLVLVL
jgi:hypothetical protein